MTRMSVAAAIAGSLLLGGCGAAVGHGPEIAMPAAWRSDVRVDRLVASSRWVLGERPFPETMTGAVADAMRACAGDGSRPLELRLHIERHGHGNSRTVEGRAEFVDMRTREVVARMPIVASASAADEKKASRRFADQICRKGFGQAVAGL